MLDIIVATHLYTIILLTYIILILDFFTRLSHRTLNNRDHVSTIKQIYKRPELCSHGSLYQVPVGFVSLRTVNGPVLKYWRFC